MFDKKEWGPMDIWQPRDSTMNTQIAFLFGLFDELQKYAHQKHPGLKIVGQAYRGPHAPWDFIVQAEENPNFRAWLKFTQNKLLVRVLEEAKYKASLKYYSAGWIYIDHNFTIAAPGFTISNLVEVIYRGIMGAGVSPNGEWLPVSDSAFPPHPYKGIHDK